MKNDWRKSKMSRKVLMAQDMDPAGKNLLVENGFELVMAPVEE